MVIAAPSDQAARERIHTDLASTLFVEAGAGTGKTRELIERIVRLVTSGRARLRNIAAITFTESAAAELRDRIRLRLEEVEQDEERFSEEERGHCTTALTELDGAAIETLHGFAQRILTEHPLEAGLPPFVEIQDEIRANITFDERWDAFVDELLGNADLEDVLLRAFTMGLVLKELRDVAWAMHENWDRVEDHEIDVPPLLPVRTRELADELLEVAGLRLHCLAPEDDIMAGQLAQLERDATKLAAAESELDQLRVLAEMTRHTINRGQRPNWPRVSIDEVRKELTGAQERRDILLAEYGANVLPPLLNAIRDFVLAYADERRHDGRLEFHDLLVRARDLLRANASVREALRAKLTHILIDEFQDTDPLQIEIAVLLASADDPTGKRWQDMEVDEGRLFFVGDVKQSIYRFRRADIELYQAAQQRYAPGVVELQQNWRSITPIIDWINEMFERLMGEGQPAGQAAYLALEPTRGDRHDGPGLKVLGGPSEKKGTSVGAIRAQEAREIAQTILAAKHERWQVFDVRTEQVRDARYADIAVLLPTRTPLQQLEDALEQAGIPYRVESQSLVYSTQDVRDLLSILRAIDDPTDEPALIAALRSPAFACADTDLLAYHKAGGRWNYRRDYDTVPADDRVATAMRSLHALHRRRWWEPINVIVEAVIRERQLFELAFAHRRPRERWQRLRFVLDQARAFAEAGGRTLRQFIDWAERQGEEDTRVVETVVPEPDDDAVRVMTIHAAKGLEFPIVFLDGLNIEKMSRRQTAVLWHPDGRLEAAIGKKHFETPGYEERATHEDGMDTLEKVRLLYVAATRARDHLIVSLHHRLGQESLASRLHALCEPTRELWRDVVPVPLPDERPEPVPFDDSKEKMDAWLAERQQRIEASQTVPTISATELVRQIAGDDDPNVRKDPPVEEVPPWRRGRAGTALGRAVHAVLQSIDLDTGADLESASMAQADAEGIANRWQEVARTVKAALESTAVREAVAGGRYWRELFVSAPVGEMSVEGFVDLLYETAGGLVVVDYKTDRAPTDAELDEALARYTPQGATYALAVEEALGKPVAKCVFVFVEAGRSREREIEDLRRAIADVRVQLGDGATRPASPASGGEQLSLFDA